MPEAPDTLAPALTATTAPLHLCHEAEAPLPAPQARAAYTLGRPAYTEGLAPLARPVSPAYDSGAILLILGLFLFVAANFRHYSKFIKTYFQDLWSLRRRANAFNDHTVSESRILVSLILVACMCEALLLFGALWPEAGGLGVMGMLGLLVAATTGYYAAQVAAYATVGWAFTDSAGAQQWLRGFNASQTLLGIALVLPALVSFFYPATAGAMLGVGCVLYVAARIVFVCKGFRIFYHRLPQLVYFILYLCALEIAPLVVAYRARLLID